MIRNMEEKDINDIVDIHLKSFPGFFLTFLGPRFLKIYYSRVCLGEDCICYVYSDEKDISVGFVVGTSNPRGFYSRLLKADWVSFGFASIPAIIKKPWVIKRIARAFLQPAKFSTSNDEAGLFSIGVNPELQKTGAGKALVRAFIKQAQNMGCKFISLETDSDNNEAVNRFYHKLGFNLENKYITPEGRSMNKYRMSITD